MTLQEVREGKARVGNRESDEEGGDDFDIPYVGAMNPLASGAGGGYPVWVTLTLFLAVSQLRKRTATLGKMIGAGENDKDDWGYDLPIGKTFLQHTRDFRYTRKRERERVIIYQIGKTILRT